MISSDNGKRCSKFAPSQILVILILLKILNAFFLLYAFKISLFKLLQVDIMIMNDNMVFWNPYSSNLWVHLVVRKKKIIKNFEVIPIPQDKS